MTVESSGGKSDRGIVGLELSPKKHAEFLLFPKSLKRFEGARIVGIKFDLVAQPKRKAVPPQAWSNVPTRRGPAAPREKPANKPVEIPPVVAPSSAAPAPKAARHASPPPRDQDRKLRGEVHAALKELEQGKAVAAYQRLQRALSAAEKRG